MVFRNRHVVTALLVAPVLAILTWFAVGALVGEKGRPARAGAAYPLVEKSSCRYASGRCEVQNGDLRLRLEAERPSAPVLRIEASHPMDTLQLAVVSPGENAEPRPLEAVAGEGRTWRIALARIPGPPQRLRLAATRSGAVFYAETSTAFLAPPEEAP